MRQRKMTVKQPRGVPERKRQSALVEPNQQSELSYIARYVLYDDTRPVEPSRWQACFQASIVKEGGREHEWLDIAQDEMRPPELKPVKLRSVQVLRECLLQTPKGTEHPERPLLEALSILHE
jgi:hypothetical protein